MKKNSLLFAAAALLATTTLSGCAENQDGKIARAHVNNLLLNTDTPEDLVGTYSKFQGPDGKDLGSVFIDSVYVTLFKEESCATYFIYEDNKKSGNAFSSKKACVPT